MSRAAIQYQRQEDRSWKPVGAWLGTTKALQSRFLPGTGLDNFERRVHRYARQPVLDDGSTGTWEDFIEYALDALSNGTDLHIAEVKPEMTVDLLYARDVLGLKGAALKRWRPRGIANVTTTPIDDLQTALTKASKGTTK